MNFDRLDTELQRQMQDIASMLETELVSLGLNSSIRDRLLDAIVVPDDPNHCWSWAGGHTMCSGKRRPALFYKSKLFLAYRVLVAILLRRRIDTLNYVLHKCPEQENCLCMNPRHLKEGTAKENAQDRSRYGTLHGDRNGSRKRPESRPRGVHNIKSQFKGPDGIFWIHTIRATYDKAIDKTGLIGALVRYSGKSRCAVSNVVRRRCYQDIPDDLSKALDLSLLTIIPPGYPPGSRKEKPRGDAHWGSMMPVAAKRALVLLFHRIAKSRFKGMLFDYCIHRYGMSRSAVQGICYKDPCRFGAPPLNEIQAMEPIDTVDEELLDSTFRDYPRIHRERKSRV